MAVVPINKYNLNAFINCPFDSRYAELFSAIVFTVHDCGFVARCAQEDNDAGQVRVDKILKIIGECRVGIHDISRVALDAKSRLPRFNMPLELGLFLGAKEYGTGRQNDKVCLVLEKERYRYRILCSDIGGQDISAHGEKVDRVISAVRDFLRSVRSATKIPGPAAILRRYRAFQRQLPALCAQTNLQVSELTFNDYSTFVSEWLAAHPPR